MPSEPVRPEGPELFVVLNDGLAARVGRVSTAGGPAVVLGDTEQAAFAGPVDPGGGALAIVNFSPGPDGMVEQLGVVDLSSGSVRMLSPHASRVRDPSWTPDGQALLYGLELEGVMDLYSVPRLGGEPKRLTDAEYGSFEPVVSPDGKWVAFGTSRDLNAELYKMRPDGSEQTRLTDHGDDDQHPKWIDSEHIAWIAHREVFPRVYVMAADGTGVRPLRESEGLDVDHAWSPDGKTAAVVTQTGPKTYYIELVDAASSKVVGTISSQNGEGVAEHPSWSPDGKQIAYTVGRGPAASVWIAKADGSDARRVSASDQVVWLPRWGKTP